MHPASLLLARHPVELPHERVGPGFEATQRGFHVLAKTEKKVVRPGQAFTLKATVVSALHTPVEVAGRAVLVRRIRTNEHWAEEDVATVDATTDARMDRLIRRAESMRAKTLREREED